MDCRNPTAVRDPMTSSRSPRRRPTMSRLKANFTRSSGTVGVRTQWDEPSNPFSSPSHSANSTDRLGGAASMRNASINSKMAEVPLALSSAPLCTAPIGPRLFIRLP